MASEQGKRFTTDNQGIRDAIVGGLTYAITGGGPGTFAGLKEYQDKMTENNKWHKDSWKDDPNYHGHALYMGDVDFVERYEGEGKTVLHSISKSDDELLHIVMYMNPEFENKLSQQNADDF